MIAQVLADAIQFMHDLDPVLPEIVRPAHARQLQELGRVERAAAKNDLAVRPDCLLRCAEAVADASRPLALEFDLRRMRFCHDGQVGAPGGDGMKIGGRSRAALAGLVGPMKLGHLIEPDPLLPRAVEIGILTIL